MLFEEFRMKYLGAMKKFVAVPLQGGNVSIVDHDGNNYGGWYDVTSFKKFVKNEPERDWNVGGKAKLVVKVI